MGLYAEISRRAVRLSPRIGVPATRFHTWLHRVSGGRMGNTFIAGGAPVLFLKTVGRKSGKPRVNPLIFLRDGERFVIAASNAGAAPHPAWFHNLMAAGEAEIEVERERLAVTAAEADPAEQARLWPRLQEIYDGFDSYQGQTRRQIPVVVLTPKR